MKNLQKLSGGGKTLILLLAMLALLAPARMMGQNDSEKSCSAPSDLQLISVNPTSVTLDWTPNGNETAWEIHYYDYSTYSETVVKDVTYHPYTVTGLQMNSGYYGFQVRAVCEDASVSDWAGWWECTTPFCNAEDQCELHYELRSNESYGWAGQYISVYYKPDEGERILVRELQSYGSFTEDDLLLCDDATYDFVWNVGSTYALEHCSFVIYGPEGEPILNYAYGEAPGSEHEDNEEITLLEGYVFRCPSCEKPWDFRVAATTVNSATFTWEAESGQTAWQFQYSTDQNNWGDMQTVTQTATCSIDQLQPATHYYARVRSVCGADDYSAWVRLDFYTDCAPLEVDATHSYSENFDSYDPYDPYGGGEWKGTRMEVSELLPFCWSSLNGSSGSMFPYIFRPYGSESNVLQFQVSKNQGAQFAILPAIAMDNIDGVTLSLRAKDGSSSTSRFSIGFMTDPTDLDTFVSWYNFEATKEWNDFVAYFYSVLSDLYIAIVVRAPESGTYNLYVDDIEISVWPTCFVPDELEVSNVQENEVTLTWTPYGDETAWQVRYSTDKTNWTVVDFTEQDYSDEVTKQLTGLLANNLYYVQVRANCGNDDYSVWSTMKSFRTKCGENQPVPYYEDFETCNYSNPLPPCWTSINTTTQSGYPSYTSSPIYISDDQPNSVSLYFYCGYVTAELTQAQYAVLPYMQDIRSLRMSFVAKGEDDNYWNRYSSAFQVGVMTDSSDPSTFHTIMSVDNFHSTTSYFNVNFDTYQGGGGYIAIKVPVETESYKLLKVDNIAVESVAHKTIEAYSNENPGWNLIASPMVGLSPLNVDNMTNETYDLYAFDENAEGHEWQNYKAHSDGFVLQSGKGYLYANSNTVTLGFAGTPYNGNGVVDLDYTAGNTYAGWNLIGNPFNDEATLNQPFYRMATGGAALNTSTETGTIAPMEGVFVQATATGQQATFTIANGEGRTVPTLNVSVSRNRGAFVDNAIIRFDEGRDLGKFTLNEKGSKLSILQGSKDYAIVRSAAQGELPINFKASENGSYTIKVEVKDTEMAYLHLIDNLTGADIDLLALRQAQGPASYTFEARTTDYSSRFKLVFVSVCGDANGDNATFAYYNGSEWVINNPSTGSATLQVVDMMGRVLSTVSANGACTLSTEGLPAGVYMFRLINNNDVKVQKVVVR